MRALTQGLAGRQLGTTESAPLLARGLAHPAASCRLAAAHRPAGRRLAAPAGRAAAPPRRGALLVTAAVKKRSGKNVACTKTLVAQEGQADAVQALCADIAQFSQARAKDRASGVLAFDCHKDNYEPNVFHFWELYEGNAAMGRHNTTPEVSRFMEDVQELLDGPVGMALYEWQDGKIGNACVQGGPRGEGGLDDATGASGAAGGASYKQTSGTVDLSECRRGCRILGLVVPLNHRGGQHCRMLVTLPMRLLCCWNGAGAVAVVCFPSAQLRRNMLS